MIVSSINDESPEREFPFTDNRLEAIKLPERGDVLYYDRGGKESRPRLALRVTAGGSRTFVIYRRVRGRPRKIRIGPLAEFTVKKARREADKINHKINVGEDPTPDRLGKRTLGEVFADYLEKRAKIRKRTWRQDQQTFDRYLRRHRNKPFAEIDGEWLGKLHRKIGQRAPIAANRLLSLLSAMFKFERSSQPNPCRGIDRYWETERARRLTAEELPRFAAAVEQYESEGGNPTMADVLRTLLWTGQRSGNVRAMRWQDLDLDGATWTLPGEFFKNGRPHVAKLPNNIVEMLRGRRRFANGYAYVFPGKRGAPHVTYIRRAWLRVLELAAIDPKTIRVHDLRATFATLMAENNENIQAIAGQLGHRDIATTQRYVRLAQKAVAQAVDRTVAAMDEMIRLKESA